MRKELFIAIFSIFALINITSADWSYPGCADVTDADFSQEVIIGKSMQLDPWLVDPSLNEPIEMALAADNQGNVDIYFTERHGNLKFYDASENTVSIIGTLDVVTVSDDGFTGIVLSPEFKETKWIYVYYTPKGNVPEVFRISRFTLTNNQLDMNSEKRIFEAEIRYATLWHNGGSMDFDIYGDMWIAFGKNCTDDRGSINENENAEWNSCENSSSNTHSARGGIIRIHPIPFPDSETPEPGIGRTYTIPKGNFGDYFALLAEAEGDAARAAEFRDTSKVLPEVFAKGTRNAWTAQVEPVKRWVAWGENGINRGYLHEEHNITRVPGFFGFPYFAGNPDTTICTDGTITCASGYNIGADMSQGFESDPEAPENNSRWNTGLKVLPPAIPSIHTYRQESAMTGPIYRYDGDLVSDVKFPPHFNNGWFLFDFNRGDKATTIGGNQGRGVTRVGFLNENLDGFTDLQDIFQPSNGHNLYGVLEAEMGPDGAMYIINYAGWFNSNVNTNIARFIYTGDCRPTEPKLEEVANPGVYYPPAGYGCTCPGDANYDAGAFALDLKACADTRNESCALSVENRHQGPGSAIYISAAAIEIKGQGRHQVTVRDVTGQQILAWENNRPATYGYEALTRPGIYFVTVMTDREQASGKVCIVKNR